MRVQQYASADAARWNAFIHGAKNGLFLFDRGFMDYHADRFADHSLMFFEGDTLMAVLPASLHGTELRSHGGLTYGGFITSEKMKQHHMNDCFDALILHLREDGINHLLYKAIPYIFHRLPSDEDLYPLWKYQARLIRRDVSTTIDLACQPKMSKGRKAQIARARREGVTIIDSVDFERFLELENRVLAEHHNTSAVHSPAELHLLHSRFPRQIRLVTAIKNNELLAGTVLFVYAETVHTQYMAASDIGREVGALDLLLSTLIEEYKDNKCYFDFGISTEQQGRVFNSGLCAQKEGFGGRSVAYDFYEWRI